MSFATSPLRYGAESERFARNVVDCVLLEIGAFQAPQTLLGDVLEGRKRKGTRFSRKQSPHRGEQLRYMRIYAQNRKSKSQHFCLASGLRLPKRFSYFSIY